MSDDPYAVGYLDGLAKKDVGRTFVNDLLFLQPSKKEDSRRTQLRMVYHPAPDKNHGQPSPVVRILMHEGLDGINPVTKKRHFPGLISGQKRTRCLNEESGDEYCNVCPTIKPLFDVSKDVKADAAPTDAPAEAKKLAKSFGMFFGNLKKTVYYYFACIHRLPEVGESRGNLSPKEGYEAGKIPLNKNGDILPEKQKESAAYWADPIKVVRIKGWWWKHLHKVLTEPAFTKATFIKKYNDGVDCDDDFYLENCPKKRGSPFHPETGWGMELLVSGHGMDQEWDVQAEEPQALGKLDKHILQKAYPDIPRKYRAYGEEELQSFDEWSAANEGGAKGYRHYRLSFLSAKQKEQLFSQPSEPEKTEKVDDDEAEMIPPKKAARDEPSAKASVDEPAADFEDIEEDIPF